MIEVNKLTGYDLDQIVTLLNKEKTATFEIAVPKSTVQFSSTNEDIAYDYLQGAYAGQQLSEVADEFECEYISATDHVSFEYTVKTSNIKALAEVILELSYGFGNGNDEDFENFHEAVYGFSDELETLKISCPDHIETYKEFLAQAEENAEDDED